MNKQVMQTMKKAKKKGLTPLEVLHMQEIAKREALKMENEAIEKSFLFMLAIPLNVLVNDYWPKSAKKRAPKFIEDVISLYESVLAETVTERELSDLLKEYAGITVNEEWLRKIEEKKVEHERREQAQERP